MNIKTLVAIALICFGLSAAAEDRIISLAYEVEISDFNAPVTAHGGASFKPCGTCDRVIVRVTPATLYSINGNAVRLEDFRKAVRQADDDDVKGLVVLHHLESNTIESIKISI